MEKSTLFENLINTTARRDTIASFAALMGVDADTVYSLFFAYRFSRKINASEMILDAGFDQICAADAPRILEAAGIRSILVDASRDDAPEVKLVCAFMSAGWRSSNTGIVYEDGEYHKALKLSRA